MTYKLVSPNWAPLVSCRLIAISGLKTQITSHQFIWHLPSLNIPDRFSSWFSPISINTNTILTAAYAKNALTHSSFFPHMSIWDNFSNPFSIFAILTHCCLISGPISYPIYSLASSKVSLPLVYSPSNPTSKLLSLWSGLNRSHYAIPWL